MAGRYAIRLREHRWARTAAACAASIVLCLLLMTWLLGLHRANLEIPFGDGGDVLLNSVVVKSLIDNGWVWRNPFLGGPYGAQLFDFPFYDNLNLALMKLIAMFSSNYAIVLNLFFLLTFPLTTISSLVVLRNFKVSYPSALVASLLFTFLPYHFQRGEAHLFLTAYFLVPLMTMVILWIWMGGSESQEQEPGRFSIPRRQIVSAAFICALIGSAVSYYTFFGCYLLCAAAVISGLRFKSPARVAWGVGLAALTFTVLTINTAPNWMYAMRHGGNPVVAKRGPAESELYGLKMTHLLLPISDHRIEFLRKTRRTYDHVIGSYEGATGTLGTIGDVGFFFVLGWLLCSPRGKTRSELPRALGVLTLSALLLGTIGGLGAIFNFLIHPQIRAYNRISIYIAFCSFFGAALLLDALKRWMGDGNRATYLWYALLGVILWLGVLDQTSSSFVPDYSRLKHGFEEQQAFVSQIEATVPRGSMIFEFPNVSFPESKPIATMKGYDEFRGYLHSRSLRWSAGAMKGRPEALWPESNGLNVGAGQLDEEAQGPHRTVLGLSPQALDALALAGFGGIYIDREGFRDFGLMLVPQLQSSLGEAPIESANRRFAFFELAGFARSLRAKYTAEQWEAERRKVLELPSSSQWSW
jgi:hypothetical protein